MFRAKYLFWAMFGVGVVLRVVASALSVGFYHPDEHQQYLEVAQGIVYGPRVTFWEYERGMRNYLYPWLLSAVLFVLDRVGIRDPLAQSAIIRAMVGILVLVAMATLARGLIAEGRVACGLIMMGFSSLNPDFIFMGVRTISETAMLIPFVFGLAILRKRPVAAGFLFGLTFAFRFQSAFFIAPLCALALLEDFRARPPGGIRSWPSARLFLGVVAGLLVMGAVDLVTWGSWFHSPIDYFRANITEKKAAQFGIHPFFHYFPTYFRMSLSTSPMMPLALLLAIGMIRDLRIGLTLAFFVLIHSLVGHKEFRFLWPTTPLVFLLIGEGYEAIDRRLAGRWRTALASLFVASLCVGAAYRVGRIEWSPEPGASSARALVELGKRPDLGGVAVFGIDKAYNGNYFYLRRDVPILVQLKVDLGSFRSDPMWESGRINYLITYKRYQPDFADIGLEEVGSIGDLATYRIGKTPAAAR